MEKKLNLRLVAVAVIALILLIIVLIGLLPILGNNSSILRQCRFNESSGGYDKCFWRWDPAL